MVSSERFEDLPVWQAAADFYGFAESLLNQPELAATPGWRDRFDRAALSISSHVARACEGALPAERFVALREARAAAAEVRSMLRVLERRRISREAQVPVARLKALAEACATQLRTYAEALQDGTSTSTARVLTPNIRARPPENRPPQAPVQHPPDIRRRTVEVARKILGILPNHQR